MDAEIALCAVRPEVARAAWTGVVLAVLALCHAVLHCLCRGTRRRPAQTALRALQAAVLERDGCTECARGSPSAAASPDAAAAAGASADNTVAPHISDCVLRLIVPDAEDARALRPGATGSAIATEAAPADPVAAPTASPAGTRTPEGAAREDGAAVATAAVKSEVLAHDAERDWALLDTLCDSLRPDEAERFWTALLRAVGVARDGSSFAGARIVVHALDRAAQAATDPAELMRTNDVHTKAYTALTRLVGAPFLDAVLQPTFQALLAPADKDFTCADMLALTAALLARVDAHADALDPAVVAAIGATFCRTAARCPSPGDAAARTAAATLLFLRYLSPGIACPAAIRDAPPAPGAAAESDDDLRVRVLLTVLAKTFQSVVNGALAPEEDDDDGNNDGKTSTSATPASTASSSGTAQSAQLHGFGVCRCACGSEDAHRALVAAAAREQRARVRGLVDRVVARHRSLDWDLAEQQRVLAHAIGLGADQPRAAAAERARQDAAAAVVRVLTAKFDAIENTLSLRDPHVTVQAQELVCKVTGKI